MATKAAERAKPRRRVVRESLLNSPDPIELAMTAAASGKPLPDVACRLLEEQALLIKAQRAELRLRHVGEGVRAILWGVLAIAAAAILALVIAVVIRAARTDALIVQSFRVPPALAAKGLTGEVVATQVLDKLAEMQAATRSSRAASSYANNWEDDLKIDIPNTGANTDQLWKLLRGWLGKETRISGEVIESANGLALTTRVGTAAGQRFVNEKRDLDELVKKGAEAIYKSTQPYRFAIYLGQTKRASERFAVLKPLTSDPSPMERKWAFSGLTFDHLSKGQFRQAIAMGNRALAIDPNMMPALGNSAAAHRALGHHQTVVDLRRRARAAPITKEYDQKQVSSSRCLSDLDIGWMTRDPHRIDQVSICLEGAPSGQSEYAAGVAVLADVFRNDPSGAIAFRQQSSEAVPEADANLWTADLQLRAHMLLGQGAGLTKAVETFASAYPRLTDARLRASQPAYEWPLHAEGLSMLGRHAEAKALIDRTPRDCYECVRVRGLVAQRMGDRTAAQRWFLEAAKQGPRLPAAFLDWGKLLLDNRRYATAEVKLRRAAELAPNWADPLKYWGDSLAAQGKRTEALAKYDAALKLAPKWHDLRKARGRLSRT